MGVSAQRRKGGVVVKTMLPAEALSSARKRAQAGAYGELESLLWFREHEDEWRSERVLMTAYHEYADAMMIAPDTLRDNLAKIRNYTPADLKRWIAKGLWLGHLERANAIAEIAGRSPKKLLDEAVEKGDEYGKPMTIDGMTAFALGDKPLPPVFFKFNVTLRKLGSIPNLAKWDDEKTERWRQWLDAGLEFFR